MTDQNPADDDGSATHDPTLGRRALLGGLAAGAAVGAAGGAGAAHLVDNASRPGMEALAPFEGTFEGEMQEYAEDGTISRVPTHEKVAFAAGGTQMIAAKATKAAFGLDAQEYTSVITYDSATDSYEMSVTGPSEAYTQVGTLADEGHLVFTGKNAVDDVTARHLGLEPGAIVATRSVMAADDDGVTFSYHLRVDNSWKEVFAKRSTRLAAETPSDL